MKNLFAVINIFAIFLLFASFQSEQTRFEISTNLSGFDATLKLF